MNIVFISFNDPTRRKILELLQEKDMTAGEIAEEFKISFPSISTTFILISAAVVLRIATLICPLPLLKTPALNPLLLL